MYINNNLCSLNSSYYNYNKSAKNSNPTFSFISPSFKSGAGNVLIKGLENATEVFDTNASKKLISIFDRKFKKLPKGLNLTVSQTTDSILSYSKDIGDGISMRATKMSTERKKQKYMYVVLKEFKQGALKDIFAIDYQTGDLIKLRDDGTLSIIKGDVIKYKEGSTDAKYLKHCKKIRQYAAAVFDEKISDPVTTTTQKVTKMRTTKADANKPNWKISESPYDDLPTEMQQDVADINETVLKLSKLIDTKRGKSSNIIDLKEKYEPVIYLGPKRKDTTFKYRNLESLAILHIPSNQRFTRIIHTNSNGIETHLLIDSNKKVVSNLNQKRPRVLPEKFRYMNQQQIEASGIGGYLKFIREEMHKYYDYMVEGLNGTEVKHRIRTPNSRQGLAQYLDDVTTKISINLNELQGDIEARANTDGQEIVKRYFATLAKSFDTYSQEGLANFKKKFDAFLNRFTNSTNS